MHGRIVGRDVVLCRTQATADLVTLEAPKAGHIRQPLTDKGVGDQDDGTFNSLSNADEEDEDVVRAQPDTNQKWLKLYPQISTLISSSKSKQL